MQHGVILCVGVELNITDPHRFVDELIVLQ